MTVIYMNEIDNSQMCGLTKLLLRWKGGFCKLLYRELLIYSTLYAILSVAYRCTDNTEFQNCFEKLCLLFQSCTDSVPIVFIMGVFVSIVLTRWWRLYMNIAWPDSLVVLIAANVHGRDRREGQQIRRNLIRYLSLGQVFSFKRLSSAVSRKYKDASDVDNAGFMTEDAQNKIKRFKFNKDEHILPFVWFSNLLSEVRMNGGIHDAVTYNTILKEMNDFRGRCAMLISLHEIGIPLVFTQVVTIAVYLFFASTLLSRQYLDVTKGYPGHQLDVYVPIFTIAQFLFYLGLLKLAGQLINPFSESDEGFNAIAIIERNFGLAMHTVDTWYLTHSNLEPDICRNDSNSVNVPNRRAFIDSNYYSSLDKKLKESPSNDHQHDSRIDHFDQVTSLSLPGKSSQIKNDKNSNEFGRFGKETKSFKNKAIAAKSEKINNSDGTVEETGEERKKAETTTRLPKATIQKSTQDFRHPVFCSDINSANNAPMMNEADHHRKNGTCSYSATETATNAMENFVLGGKPQRPERPEDQKKRKLPHHNKVEDYTIAPPYARSSSDSWPKHKSHSGLAKVKRLSYPIQAASCNNTNVYDTFGDLRRDADGRLHEVGIKRGTAGRQPKGVCESEVGASNSALLQKASDVNRKKNVEEDRKFGI